MTKYLKYYVWSENYLMVFIYYSFTDLTSLLVLLHAIINCYIFDSISVAIYL